MNSLQAAFLLAGNKEAMPSWAKAERYNFCESKGLSFFYRLFNR